MKNIYKYILLSVISGVTLIGVIDYSVKANQKFSPLNISQNTTNTEDLPILQSPIAKKVYDTAKNITVMIKGKGDVIRIGSGVIIAKNGDTYYVLTAEHVFRGFTELEITTPDGKVYPIKINEQEARIGETDLGVLEFSSKDNYQVVTLPSSQVKDRDIVFTYGFPREEIIKGNNRGLFSVGYIWSSERSVTQGSNANLFFSGGYELAYSNLTAKGVSGGPVLDHQGRLLGIHGRVDGYDEVDVTGNLLEVYLGYSIGVPVGYLFGDLVKDKNWKTYLQQDNGNISILSADTKNELLETVAKSLKAPIENSAFAWLNYGNQLWRYGKYLLAIDAFEKAISLKSDLYYAYYHKGLGLYDLGKYQETIAIIEKAIYIYNQTNISDIEKTFIFACLDLQSRALRSVEKYEEALKVNEQSFQLNIDKEDNRNFILYFQKGYLLEKLKRYQESIYIYSKVIQINSSHSWAYINRGNSYDELKEYAKALSDYNQAILLNPNFAESYYNRGLTYTKLKEYEKAISDYSQAILLNPQLAEAYNNRGFIYSQLKQYEKALSDYNQGILLNPNFARTYYDRGFIYSQLKQYEKALSDYNQAISLNLQDTNAYNHRGNTYKELKEYDKALSDYNQAILLDPKYAEAYSNRATTYKELKEYKKAISDYSQAILLNPQFTQSYYNRGVTYQELQEYEKAISDYNQAISLDPQFIEVYYNRAYIYDVEKEYQKAISDYSRVISLKPQYAEAYNNRGSIYKELKEYEKALNDYNQAILLNPQSGEAYYNRSTIYAILGDKKKAINDLEKAKTIFCQQGSFLCETLKQLLQKLE